MGEVAFIGPVDVRGLSLDDIIDVEKGRIQVYGLPGGAQRPPIGQGLNQPALLTFRLDVQLKMSLAWHWALLTALLASVQRTSIFSISAWCGPI